MRETKFRVWCLERNEWEHGDTLIDQDGALWHRAHVGMFPIKPETHIVMHSIGAKDINGTDIYEGDILRDDYDRILVVEWRNYGWCFKAMTPTNFEYAYQVSEWFYGDTLRPEIIGNIHESKEFEDK